MTHQIKMAETIGWLTDKIIISELKIYHMAEQTVRTDVDEAHKQMCRQKIDVLKLQRDDLKAELDQLLKDTALGKTRPKIYRQFKMYNDPKYFSRK